MDDELAATARVQHGVFSRKQALDSGVTRSAIRTALKRGLWQQVLPGVYYVRGAPVTHLSRAWAVRLAITGVIAFTGRTAALLLGAPDIDGEADVEVAILNKRRERRLPRVIVRRVTAKWLSRQWTETELPILSPAAVLFDFAATAREPEVRRLAEWLLRERLITLDQLRGLRRKGRPGSAAVAEVIRVLSDGHDYWAGRAAALFEKAGLPPSRREVPVRTSLGTSYLDVYFEAQGRAVEIDDYDSHSRSRRFRRDRRRHNAIQDELGILFNYFTPVDIRDCPDEVVATMRKALTGASSVAGPTQSLAAPG
jgi:hypothetical protein